MPPFQNFSQWIPQRLYALGAAAGLGMAALSLPGCGGEDPIAAKTDIDPTPLPPDTGTNPPGTIYDCIPSENSFLLLLKGYGIQHPERQLDAEGNPTDQLMMSPPKNGCSVRSIKRLGASEGQQTEVGIPYWSEAPWSNVPNPFLKFDDPNYQAAITLLQGRSLGHAYDDLYRGFAGSDVRKQGSWGGLFALAGLPTLGQNAGVKWGVEMLINPETCAAELTPWQAEGTEDEDKWVLDFYREEACSGAEKIPAADTQTVTVCDNATSQPCKTVGEKTALQKLEATLIALPLGGNVEEEAKFVSGAQSSCEDEMTVPLDMGGIRPKIQYQLTKEPVQP